MNRFNYIETRKRGCANTRFLVYVISSFVIKELYVGCTTQRITERWRTHKKDAITRYRNCHLQKAIVKHSPDKFDIEVIGEYRNKQEMLNAEKLWMILLNTIHPNGLNENKYSTVNYGWKQSDEAKRKISIANSGRKRTVEMSIRQSERQRGIKASPETKEKMKVSATGRLNPKSFGEAIRQRKLGPKKINGKMVYKISQTSLQR